VFKTDCLTKVYRQKNRLPRRHAFIGWTARCSPFGHKFSQEVSTGQTTEFCSKPF